MADTDTIANSNLVDPLVGYSPLSFSLSSSFRPLSNTDSNSLLDHLKNMVVRNPDSLVNQARTIRDSSMDTLESDKSKDTDPEDKSAAPLTVSDKNPRERRPGLGLKRAKFSAKPMPSLPDTCLEPSMDMDNLKDPDEFFAAFDRMEHAKKELQRLRGQPLKEMDQNRATLQPRVRRPSLLGKSATYKHRSYTSTEVPNKDEALLSSQEAYDHNTLSPTREDSISKIDAMNLSPETRISDIRPATSSKVSELDNLLSLDYDALDQDGIQSLLQDKLNIKLANIEKLSFPDIPDIRRRDMNDTIFHGDDRNKAASSKPLTFSYQLRKSSTSHSASASTLNKQISILTPPNNPISPLQIDSSLEVISNPEALAHVRNVSGEETPGDLTSPPTLAGDSRSPNIGSKERLDVISNSELIVSSKDSLDPGRSSAHGEDNIMVLEKLPSLMANDTTCADDPEVCNRSPKDTEETFSAFGEASLACETPIEQADQIDADLEPVGKETIAEGSAVEKASVNGGGDGEMGEPLNTPGSLTQKPNKKIAGSSKSRRKQTEVSTESPQENISEETVNEVRKEKAKSNAPVVKEPTKKKRKIGGASPPSRKDDEKLRRLSLYAAGTKWEAGLRRSSRIRMRPLEYWKGERFLYGRVHKSLVSVIGVKYASPGKDAGEPAVKVKSFVSDEYKNLLELASSH